MVKALKLQKNTQARKAGDCRTLISTVAEKNQTRVQKKIILEGLDLTSSFSHLQKTLGKKYSCKLEPEKKKKEAEVSSLASMIVCFT